MEIESKLSLPGIEPGLPVYIELFLGIAYRFVFEFQIIYLVFFVLCEMFIELLRKTCNSSWKRQ